MNVPHFPILRVVTTPTIKNLKEEDEPIWTSAMYHMVTMFVFYIRSYKKSLYFSCRYIDKRPYIYPYCNTNPYKSTHKLPLYSCYTHIPLFNFFILRYVYFFILWGCCQASCQIRSSQPTIIWLSTPRTKLYTPHNNKHHTSLSLSFTSLQFFILCTT